MEKIYISLGSNLGDKAGNLLNACGLIEKRLGKIINRSNIYETEPWGFESSEQFLNQVVCIGSEESAQTIMQIFLAIENEMGRIRNQERYSSRVIDIDVLFIGQQIIKDETIEVPHPRLHERNFVLIPLKDIAPDFVHPKLNRTISELLNDCKDAQKVKIFKQIIF